VHLLDKKSFIRIHIGKVERHELKIRAERNAEKIFYKMYRVLCVERIWKRYKCLKFFGEHLNQFISGGISLVYNWSNGCINFMYF
jgi:hypothetical protein